MTITESESRFILLEVFLKNSKNNFDMTPFSYTKNKKLAGFVVFLLLCSSILDAQKNNDFEVKSPDGTISVKVDASVKLEWSVEANGEQIIAPSAISLSLEDGTVLGDNPKVSSSNTEKINTVIAAINYIKASIPDDCNQLTINCKNGYGVI